MTADLKDLIAAWDGLGVVCRYDAPTGAWIFICLHDDRLGPPTGGSRMKVYPRPEDGLVDAMRLAEGMTAKWAGIGVGFGGGKAVLALSRPLDKEARRGLLLRYGDLIASLSGTFQTGEDLGTSSEDMALVAERTRYVHGFDPETGQKIDPSPFTARGVWSGLRAALGTVFGNDDPAGRSVLIEGVGNVGRHLAELLAEGGSRLLLCDLDRARADAVARDLGGEVVSGDDVYSTPCDVYAPCAVGATLNQETIPRLTCRIVAGSANNQLAETEDAERLHRRGVLYVPDYVVNAGGALAFSLLDRGVSERRTLLARMDQVGATVREILAEAAARGESPLAAAHRRVERVLAGAGAGSPAAQPVS